MDEICNYLIKYSNIDDMNQSFDQLYKFAKDDGIDVHLKMESIISIFESSNGNERLYIIIKYIFPTYKIKQWENYTLDTKKTIFDFFYQRFMKSDNTLIWSLSAVYLSYFVAYCVSESIRDPKGDAKDFLAFFYNNIFLDDIVFNERHMELFQELKKRNVVTSLNEVINFFNIPSCNDLLRETFSKITRENFEENQLLFFDDFFEYINPNNSEMIYINTQIQSALRRYINNRDKDGFQRFITYLNSILMKNYTFYADNKILLEDYHDVFSHLIENQEIRAIILDFYICIADIHSTIPIKKYNLLNHISPQFVSILISSFSKFTAENDVKDDSSDSSLHSDFTCLESIVQYLNNDCIQYLIHVLDKNAENIAIKILFLHIFCNIKERLNDMLFANIISLFNPRFSYFITKNAFLVLNNFIENNCVLINDKNFYNHLMNIFSIRYSYDLNQQDLNLKQLYVLQEYFSLYNSEIKFNIDFHHIVNFLLNLSSSNYENVRALSFSLMSLFVEIVSEDFPLQDLLLKVIEFLGVKLHSEIASVLSILDSIFIRIMEFRIPVNNEFHEHFFAFLDRTSSIYDNEVIAEWFKAFESFLLMTKNNVAIQWRIDEFIQKTLIIRLQKLYSNEDTDNSILGRSSYLLNSLILLNKIDTKDDNDIFNLVISKFYTISNSLKSYINHSKLLFVLVAIIERYPDASSGTLLSPKHYIEPLFKCCNKLVDMPINKFDEENRRTAFFIIDVITDILYKVLLLYRTRIGDTFYLLKKFLKIVHFAHKYIPLDDKTFFKLTNYIYHLYIIFKRDVLIYCGEHGLIEIIELSHLFTDINSQDLTEVDLSKVRTLYSELKKLKY